MATPCAVMIAPDRTATYVAAVIDRDLAAMRDGDVLEVRFATPTARLELADWAIRAGRPVRNPFDLPSSTRLLVERAATSA